MKITIPLLVAIFLFISGLYGQNTTDSLSTVLREKNLTPDSRMEILYKLAVLHSTGSNTEYAYQLLSLAASQNNYKYATAALDLLIGHYDSEGSYDSSVLLSSRAIVLAAKEKNKGDIVYFSTLCGTANMNAGNYYAALEKYTEAADIAHSNEWFISESSILNNIGGIYYNLGDEISALNFFLNSLKLKEEQGETKKLAGALINIGGLYNQLGDHQEGLEFLEKAYKNAVEQNDLYMQSKALISIGDVYFKLEEYSKARNYYQKALPLANTTNDGRTKANIIVKTGDTYRMENNTDEALSYYLKSLSLSDSINYKPGIATASIETGKIFYDRGEYQKANKYLTKAEREAKKTSAIGKLLDSYNLLAEVHQSMANYNKALDYHKKYTVIKDSLYNADTHDRYTAVKALYEVDKKQRELDNLRLKNEITQLEARQSKYFMYGTFGLALLVVFAIVLAMRQQKVKSLQKTIKLEQKLLRSQINPHFIFNALTAVQRFIFEKSTILASDYIGNFANLIRFTLNSSTVDNISLEDEIVFLRNYLTLQAVRFDNKFSFKIVKSDDIHTGLLFIPPMLIQPVVENAIEHGVNHLKENGHINIGFKKINGLLKVVVEDNGVGRKKSGIINSRKKNKHKSLSTVITSERLLFLNKNSDKKVSLEYYDLKGDNGRAAGTKVVLNIPFYNKVV